MSTQHVRGATVPETRRLLATCSLLLGYPEQTTIDRIAVVRDNIGQLPEAARGPVLRLATWLADNALVQSQTHYVEIFDRRRKACLYLTYFLNGDTRRRGMALVEFKEAYQADGFDIGPEELPDFLPVVLEFGAVGSVDVALEQLARHRAGLEILEHALALFSSPYADAVTALLTVVPDAPSGPTAEELAFAGPPVEQVGLAPFFSVDSVRAGARA